MAITSAFQADDAGSIPAARSTFYLASLSFFSDTPSTLRRMLAVSIVLIPVLE
jgi:hypothetical protein